MVGQTAPPATLGVRSLIALLVTDRDGRLIGTGDSVHPNLQWNGIAGWRARRDDDVDLVDGHKPLRCAGRVPTYQARKGHLRRNTTDQDRWRSERVRDQHGRHISVFYSSIDWS